MTQPPEDPQGQDNPKQPGLPPYGHDPQQPYQPQPGYQQSPTPYFPGQNVPRPVATSNNTNLVLGLVLGPILGAAFGAVLTFALFFEMVDSMSTSGAVTLAIVLPFLLPIPLLFFKQTRPWGFGMLMGVALGSVVLAGSCVLIIEGLSVG